MNLHKFIIVLFALTLTGLFPSDVIASHVAGGNMSYRCLGNSRYEITLEFRRDCRDPNPNTDFDDPALFSVFDGTNYQIIETLPNEGRYLVNFVDEDTLNFELKSDCNIFGRDLCVQTTTYKDTLVLPERSTGYIIAYQRCCRNNTLNNIVDPLNTGATYWVRLTGAALEQCNSSPVFEEWPNVFVCVNDTLRFNDSAIDIDGDSLVYFLCTPSAGGTDADPKPNPIENPPFPLVQFATGFSEGNMMGGSPISIDSETGQVLAVPDQIGQYVVGVCVRDYRDGVLLSEIRRDFELNVRVCGRAPVADFQPDFETRCDGLTINFDNTSTSNFLPPEDLASTWFFDWPNTTSVSNESNPAFTFPEPGRYDVLLRVNDGECTDSIIMSVGVSLPNDPTANFVFEPFDCDGNTVIQFQEMSTTSQSDTSHIWIVDHSGRTDTLFGLSPMLDIGFDQTINVKYEITTESGCNDILEQSIAIVTEPFRVEFIDKIICAGENAVIFSTDLSDVDVSITPSANVIDDGNGTFSVNNFTGTQDFEVFVSDDFCSAQDTVTISSASDPTFPLPDIVQCGLEDTISLNANGPDFYFYEWEGPTITDPNVVNPVASLLNNATYFVTISTSPGSLCRFNDTINVIVSDLPEFNILPFDQIIYCDGDSITLSLDDTFTQVDWTNELGELIGQGQTYDVNGLTSSVVITATATNENGCTSSNEVAINHIDLPIINFSSNTINTVCKGEDAILEVISSDSIVWTNIEGDILGTGTNITIDSIQEIQLVNVLAINEFGCMNSNSILIDLFPDPVIDFTPLDDIIICPEMRIPIGLMTNDSVTWFGPNGEILTTGQELLLGGIIGNISYSVEVVNEFGCSLRDTFNIIVDPSIVPEVDISILDSINICVDTDFFVSIESMDSITWLDLNGTVLQIGNEFEVTDVTDTLVYVISVVDEFGCELLDTFELLTYEGIDLQLDTEAMNDFYCEGESIEIIGYTNAESTITWYNADSIIFVGDTLSGYFPIGDVSIIAIAEDDFGCMSSDTFDLRESQTEGEIIGDDLICIDGLSTLNYIPEVDTDQFSIGWSPAEFIVEDNGLSVIVGPEMTTVFNAIYSNEDGCITEDDFTVEVTGFFDGILAFADPEEILLGESSELSTDQEDDLDYVWEPSESLDDASSATPIATPLETTTYMVTVTDENGCTESAQVTVNVIQPNCDESDIFVPNMFTPNGDMFNDNFKVESNFIKELELLIYNRLGEEVYRSNDINAAWDGTFDGKELPPDVFGYHLRIVCINDLEYMKQGNITLMK